MSLPRPLLVVASLLLTCLAVGLGFPAHAAPPPAGHTAAAAAASAATADGSRPRARASAEPDAAALGTLPGDIGIAVGQPAPDATVEREDGSTVQLSDWIGEGTVLVVFYRGGWCPYCNYQLRDLTNHAADFTSRGITPLLISVDRVDEAARTQASWVIPFPVLSDPGLSAHEAFGVTFRADDAEVARLAGFGIDLEKSSGQTHHSFAVPSLFLVDSDGVVRWAHADLDYKRRPSVDQLFSAVDAVMPPTP